MCYLHLNVECMTSSEILVLGLSEVFLTSLILGYVCGLFIGVLIWSFAKRGHRV